MASRFLREDLKSFSPYSVTYYPDFIKLDANENPYEIPDEVKEEIKEGFSNLSLRIYPDPSALELRKAISSFLNINGLTEENIAVGNGSDELLQYIFIAFLNKGDIVVYPNLSFEMFPILSQIAGVKDIKLDINDSLELETESVINAFYRYRPKLFLICRPNNPTGWAIPKEELLSILEEARRNNVLVVLDEAYTEFMSETLVYLVNDYDNLIVLRTFSKCFSLAGLRLGYAVSSREIVNDLMAVKLPYNVDIFSQMVGKIVLKYKDIILSRVEGIIRERGRLYESLSRLSKIKVFPSNANFLFFYCNDDCLMEKLLSYKIKIRRFEPKHPLLKNAYRVTVGKKEENDKFISAMEEILA